MLEIGDKEQRIIWTEVGGTVTRWNYKGVEILFPQQQIFVGGERKLRGGMHTCFPNFGTAPTRFGLPKHGLLRELEAEEVKGDACLVFSGTDLLGAASNADCEVRAGVMLESGGFSYTLSARLRTLGSEPVSLNAGFHPYFRTPRGTAKVEVVPHRKFEVADETMEPLFCPMKKGAFIEIPGLGYVTLQMSGSAWEKASNPQIVLWRDSKEYLCVEPVMGIPGIYGEPHTLFLTEAELDLTCKLTFLPNPD